MSAQPKANQWKRWFAAPEPSRPTWWRLVRFEHVDSNGMPVGKPIVAMTPSNFPRNFRSEAIAEGVAQLLNEEEGR